MTKSTITRERLEKIRSWRETYGAGSNVMLPAEEAEELARMALAAMDSEPVVYASEETLAYAAHGELLLRVLSQPAGDAIIPLYRHAQQPVVPEEKPMPNTLSMYAVDAVAAIAEVKGWNAFRAARLNHPSRIQPNTDAAPGTEIKHPSSNSPVIGIDLASGPDRTVEVRYVAPPGYVMVPKEPTEEMLAAAKEWTGLTRTAEAVYIKMLAAAPQEVPDGK